MTDPKKRVAYLRYGDPEADAPSADPVIPNRDPKGFYQLLEISPYVSMADVATAYQKAIKKLGPNKAKYSREDLEKYDALRKAFYHLSDSKKRLKYDVSGEGE